MKAEAVAKALRSVRLENWQIEAALKELGKPGSLAEACVWTAANAYLKARAALDAPDEPSDVPALGQQTMRVS